MKMQIHFYLKKKKKKIKSTSNEDVDPFLILRKRIVNMQIFDITKEIITIIKELRTCFNKIN